MENSCLHAGICFLESLLTCYKPMSFQNTSRVPSKNISCFHWISHVTMLRLWSVKNLKLWVLAAADRDQHSHWRSGWENGPENAVWRSNLPSHTGYIPGLILALQLLCHSLVQDTTFLSCCPSLLPSACNRVFCQHHETGDLSFLGQISSACVCVCIVGTFHLLGLHSVNYLTNNWGLRFRLIFEYGPKEYQNDISNIDIAELSS
jgi:hypothetical protein